jgi:transcriptional regulator with GAF, ATPase, and Fis domain
VNNSGVVKPSGNTTSKALNGSFEEGIRFERLISELSAKFISLPANQIDTEIKAGIKLIVEFLNFDWGALSEFSDGGKSLNTTHIYSAAEVEMSFPKRLHLRVPAATAILRRGQPIILSRDADIPAKWTLEKAFTRKAGIKSCLLFPLKVGNQVLGALGFYMLRSEVTWPDMLVKQLSLLAEIFGNALSRKNASLQIQEDMEFEELLSAISSRFINLPASEVDQIVVETLKDLIDFLNVDRASIYLYDAKRKVYGISHQKSRKGTRKNPTELTEQDTPWLAQKVKGGRGLLIYPY